MTDPLENKVRHSGWKAPAARLLTVPIALGLMGATIAADVKTSADGRPSLEVAAAEAGEVRKTYDHLGRKVRTEVVLDDDRYDCFESVRNIPADRIFEEGKRAYDEHSYSRAELIFTYAVSEVRPPGYDSDM